MNSEDFRSNASKLHRNVYNIVKECYPSEGIKQEHPIKIGSQTLYLDIYIPRLKIAVECNGQQHYKFNKFYHQDGKAFAKQKVNDRAKREYCEFNGITLIDIKYNDKLSVDFIQDKILKELKGGD